MVSNKRPPAGGGAAIKPPASAAKPSKSIPPTSKSDDSPLMVTYQVRGELVSVAFGEEVYPVKDGRVELPAGAQWYAHLVQSGQLFQE